MDNSFKMSLTLEFRGETYTLNQADWQLCNATCVAESLVSKILREIANKVSYAEAEELHIPKARRYCYHCGLPYSAEKCPECGNSKTSVAPNYKTKMRRD